MQDIYLWLDSIPVVYYTICGVGLVALCYGMDKLRGE